jgi:hypothetical protein
MAATAKIRLPRVLLSDIITAPLVVTVAGPDVVALAVALPEAMVLPDAIALPDADADADAEAGATTLS